MTAKAMIILVAALGYLAPVSSHGQTVSPIAMRAPETQLDSTQLATNQVQSKDYVATGAVIGALAGAGLAIYSMRHDDAALGPVAVGIAAALGAAIGAGIGWLVTKAKT